MCRAFISTACDREGCSYQLGPLSCKLSICLHVYFFSILQWAVSWLATTYSEHLANGAPCCPPETISNTEQIPSTVGDTFRCFYDCMDSENVSTVEILKHETCVEDGQWPAACLQSWHVQRDAAKTLLSRCFVLGQISGWHTHSSCFCKVLLLRDHPDLSLEYCEIQDHFLTSWFALGCTIARIHRAVICRCQFVLPWFWPT